MFLYPTSTSWRSKSSGLSFFFFFCTYLIVFVCFSGLVRSLCSYLFLARLVIRRRPYSWRTFKYDVRPRFYESWRTSRRHGAVRKRELAQNTPVLSWPCARNRFSRLLRRQFFPCRPS